MQLYLGSCFGKQFHHLKIGHVTVACSFCDISGNLWSVMKVYVDVILKDLLWWRSFGKCYLLKRNFFLNYNCVIFLDHLPNQCWAINSMFITVCEHAIVGHCSIRVCIAYPHMQTNKQWRRERFARAPPCVLYMFPCVVCLGG